MQQVQEKMRTGCPRYVPRASCPYFIEAALRAVGEEGGLRGESAFGGRGDGGQPCQCGGQADGGEQVEGDGGEDFGRVGGEEAAGHADEEAVDAGRHEGEMKAGGGAEKAGDDADQRDFGEDEADQLCAAGADGAEDAELEAPCVDGGDDHVRDAEGGDEKCAEGHDGERIDDARDEGFDPRFKLDGGGGLEAFAREGLAEVAHVRGSA